MKKQERWHAWSRIALLYLPVALLYIAHYGAARWNPDRIGTGFLQADQPYYMANARQYVDGVTDGLRYGSPFSAQEDPAPIYFQPQFAVLGWLWKITGVDPGLLFVLFGAVFGLLCVRACVRVLDHALPPKVPWRGLIQFLFLWGGGLLFLIGFAWGLVQGNDPVLAFTDSFRFDPFGGWWFLNLGRNLVYPLEAYYHFLFFTIVLSILQKRFVRAALVAGLLGMSHPFTGVATLLMLLAWAALERWYMRMREVPRWFIPSTGATLLLVLIYYGPVLGSDPEHAVLTEQWKLAWVEDAITFIPAYALVGLLALGRVRSPQRALTMLGSPFGRLLVVWTGIWFALENHEFAMDPVQPLHFTRGYTWSALFLIGAPFLADLWQKLQGYSKRVVVLAAIVTISSFFLLDNAVWMARQTRANVSGVGASIQITRDQRELFNWLEEEAPANSFLVSSDPMTAYMALVYTPHRAYYSHMYNTPHNILREQSLADYFQGRITDPLLHLDLVAVVYADDLPFVFAERGELLFANTSYSVYHMPASR